LAVREISYPALVSSAFLEVLNAAIEGRLNIFFEAELVPQSQGVLVSL
jgi:hypothetical protein